MPGGFQVAPGEEEHEVRRRVETADEYLAAVDDEVFSLALGAEGVRLLVGFIRACFRLGEEFPGHGRIAEDTGEVAHLLFLGPAGQDGRGAEDSSRRVIGGEGEFALRRFAPDHGCVGGIQPAAAVLFGEGREEPALLADFFGELLPFEELFVGDVAGIAGEDHVLRDVCVEEVTYLPGKGFQFRGYY